MILSAHSYYSLRYGTIPLEELVQLSKTNGFSFLALTDINNSTGIPDHINECRKNGIEPIAGIEFRDPAGKHLFTGIAKNIHGLNELNILLSEYLAGNQLPKRPSSNNAFFIYPFSEIPSTNLYENEFIAIKHADINKFRTQHSGTLLNKTVIAQPVTFKDSGDYHLHKHLRAIDQNTLLTKVKAEDLADIGETIMSISNFLKPYDSISGIIKNTENLISQCNLDFDLKSPKNKKTFTGAINEDRDLLRRLAFEGLEYRYGSGNRKATELLEKELLIIDKLGFGAYFLIAWDIVRYSMLKGYYHVGRGSGANSITAYCLKITNVDPVELNLHFERFINPKRTSPPDFDIDFSWKDRDDIQNYIFNKYGKEHTALLGTTTTFKGRSIYRELGKVYGLPKEEIDSLIQSPNDFKERDHIFRKIFSLAEKMADFPNMRSIHAGGILVSELPITYYTALDLPPKGLPTTQWDMYVAEAIGFEKLDILSQRGIGHIRECTEIVEQNNGISIDIHDVEKFKKDPHVKELLKTGETNGCFYIESPAMRGLLKKLRCDNYISLVAASSIIRPGVARSGMMKEYIHRFHHPESFQYLHPVMEEQLNETFGIMVYQEDVLKICHHFAGLDLSDADVLRRAMSGKYRSKSEFLRIVDRFFENCKKYGYPDNITKEVWRQIESFAGYSFSKAHSASYAVESFQSLYLKACYPKEFMVAVINNFGGYFRTWVYFNEARRWGAKINLPCVNNSNYMTRIVDEDIYIGFVHIEHLEASIGKKIEKERNKNGEFATLSDFLNRTNSTLESILILIKTGAFRFTGKTKAKLLWEAHMLVNKAVKTVTPKSLFPVEEKEFIMPELKQTKIEDCYDEIELLGFPVTLTYFDLLQTRYRGEITAKKLKDFVGKQVKMIGLLATIKYVRTIKKEIMHFGTFIDSEGEFFDTVNFPDVAKEYPFRGDGVYLILGNVVEEYGFPQIEVQKMAKLPLQPRPNE